MPLNVRVLWYRRHGTERILREDERSIPGRTGGHRAPRTRTTPSTSISAANARLHGDYLPTFAVASTGTPVNAGRSRTAARPPPLHLGGRRTPYLDSDRDWVGGRRGARLMGFRSAETTVLGRHRRPVYASSSAERRKCNSATYLVHSQ